MIMILDRTKPQEIYGVQILRGIAAAAVGLHHTLGVSDAVPGAFSPKWVSTFGAIGVDIFFVISGFIMYYVTFRADRPIISPIDFLTRRIVRIYPLYWVCCLGIAAIMACGFLGLLALTPQNIFNSIFLLPDQKKLLGVSWTLSYEVYFYLIFAGMLWFRSPQNTLVGVTAAIGAVMIVASLFPASDMTILLTSGICFEFCFGLWLAWTFTNARRWALTPAMAIPAAILVAVPLLLGYRDMNLSKDGWRMLLWGVPALVIVASCLTVRKPGGAIGRLLLLLGDASYSIYLTHWFVVFAYQYLLRKPAIGELYQLPLVVLVSVIFLCVGVATHLLVEKPLTRLVGQIGHRRPARLQRA